MLIILNEIIDVLTPENIAYRLRRTANKRNPDKSYQFLEINYVLIISEAHFSPSPNNEMGFLIINQPIDHIVEFKYKKFIRFLTKKWSEFNNSPLYETGELNSIKDLKILSVAQYNKDQEKNITRQESGKRYYKWNPYFRNYNEEWLKWVFKIMMTELAFGMTKKGTQMHKDRRMEVLHILWKK